MSQDYGKNKKKPTRKNQKNRRTASLPSWVIFCSGVAFAFFAQFLFHLATMDKPVQTRQTANIDGESDEPTLKKPTINFYNQLKTMEVKVPGEDARPSKSGNSTLAIEKTAEKPVAKPATIKLETTTANSTTKTTATTDAASSTKTNNLHEEKSDIAEILAEKPVNKSTYSYMLQAGSFKKTADAEEHRAKLSMMGMKTSIETKTGSDGITWHRIIIGPFDSATELNRARGTLNKNSVPTMTVKR